MAYDASKAPIVTDETDQFTLPLGRLVFHNLFTPVQFEAPDGKKSDPKYGATLAYPKDTNFAETLDKALIRLMNQPGFPSNAAPKGSKREANLIASGLDPEAIKTFTRGLKFNHDIEKYPHLEDMVCISCNANEKFPPVVVDAAKNRISKERQEEIYRGVWGVPLVTLGYFKATGQLYFKLKAFQKVKDDAPLSSSSSKIDLFQSFAEVITPESMMDPSSEL